MASNQSSSSANPTNSGRNGKVYKVIIIGDADVGKTALTYRFCEGTFLQQCEATIGVDFRTKTLFIDDEQITLQLWDTAGQERYRMSMVKHYYRNADAVVLVYDVTRPDSFNSLIKWIDESSLNCLDDIPKILIGNKCDGYAAVARNQAQMFADSHDMPLFETSAKLDAEGPNVEAIFLTLAHKLKHHKKYIPKPSTIRADVKTDTSKKSSCSC